MIASLSIAPFRADLDHNFDKNMKIIEKSASFAAYFSKNCLISSLSIRPC